MKIITTILGIIFMLNLVSALDLTAGETKTIELEITPDNCSIYDQDNSLSDYEIDGLQFFVDGNKVTIITNPKLEPKVYNLVCDYHWEESLHDGTTKSSSGTYRYKQENMPSGGGRAVSDQSSDFEDNEQIAETEQEIIEKPNYVLQIILGIILLIVLVIITSWIIKKNENR